MHNYLKLGLKVGLEIHQQLEGRKLFCSCPTLLREDTPSFTVRRKLRASAGEEGEIDIAAAQEHMRERIFTYEGYDDTTCLVELDEEPPHEVNPEALYTTLQLCKLLHAEVSSVVQVMRKTVVDGSNTSGFQRTALLGRNGTLSSSQGEVTVTWINIEEDACKIVNESAEKKSETKANKIPEEKIYRLDRLGIPLIEIGTGPEIHSPEQCQEVAKKLGMLLRSFSGVKRGLGTIRQDVNISIAGGNRIEIKGAQDLQQLPLLVELEVKRQAELLKIKEELRGIRLNPLEIIDLTTLLSDCPSKIIQNTLQKGGKILGMKLHGFASFVGRELQPNYRLGTEFSGRAKIKAGVGGIFHSDELPNYGITDVVRIKKKLKCDDKDAFILVADQQAKAQLALHAVHERAQEVLAVGVPKEVRKANVDGSTSYLRPMPGAARMYPETDVPLIRPDLTSVQIPEMLEEKILRYQEKFGLSADLAVFIARSEKVALFEELVVKYPQNTHPLMKPAFIAETLTSRLLEIKRNYQEDSDKLTDDNFREVFRLLQENKIHKDIVLDVLIDMIRGKFNLEYYAGMGTEKIHEVLKEIVAKNKGAPFPALMGMAMKQLKGKASGEFIAEHLKKVMEERHE